MVYFDFVFLFICWWLVIWLVLLIACVGFDCLFMVCFGWVFRHVCGCCFVVILVGADVCVCFMFAICMMFVLLIVSLLYAGWLVCLLFG